MAASEFTPGQSIRIQEARKEYEISRALDVEGLSDTELEEIFNPPSLLKRVRSLMDHIPGPVSGFRHD